MNPSTYYTLKITYENTQNNIQAPQEFVYSCETFTNMFEDIGVENVIIPITNIFKHDEIVLYIKLFMDLYSLKVTNNAGTEMSYLDYIIDYRNEYIENYTNRDVDPPHCNQLFQIYNELGEENIVKMLNIDGYFNNLKLQHGIILLIVAYIRSGTQEKVDYLIKTIMKIVEK